MPTTKETILALWDQASQGSQQAAWLLNAIFEGIEIRCQAWSDAADKLPREPLVSPAVRQASSILWVLKHGGKLSAKKRAHIVEAGREDTAIEILRSQGREHEWYAMEPPGDTAS